MADGVPYEQHCETFDERQASSLLAVVLVMIAAGFVDSHAHVSGMHGVPSSVEGAVVHMLVSTVMAFFHLDDELPWERLDSWAEIDTRMEAGVDSPWSGEQAS